MTVGDAVDSMRRHTYESAAAVALCDDGYLRGLVSIERLFATRDDTRLIDVAETDPPVVCPGVDQEVAAWRAYGTAKAAWQSSTTTIGSLD